MGQIKNIKLHIVTDIKSESRQNGYLQRQLAQTPCDRWSQETVDHEKEALFGTTKCSHQARTEKNSRSSMQRWKHETPSDATRCGKLFLGIGEHFTKNKNAGVQIDATPFKQWYENHYGQPLGRKKGHSKAGGELEDDPLNKPRSHHLQRKIDARKPMAKLDQHLEDQFTSGRLLACISSRPGQSGRCDGYILEGKELDFYLKKLKTKRGK